MKLMLIGSDLVVDVDKPGPLPRGARTARDGKTLWVAYRGETYRFQEVTRVRAHEEEHALVAPMPGKVTKVLVAAGDTVTKGRPLLVLEAMKMEHEIRAPRDGTVKRVHRAAGEMVSLADPLVEME